MTLLIRARVHVVFYKIFVMPWGTTLPSVVDATTVGNFYDAGKHRLLGFPTRLCQLSHPFVWNIPRLFTIFPCICSVNARECW